MGPNSSGELVNEDTALGFRRLSIIVINDGMQPIYNEDKSKAEFLTEKFITTKVLERIDQQGHTFTTETDYRSIVTWF